MRPRARTTTLAGITVFLAVAALTLSGCSSAVTPDPSAEPTDSLVPAAEGKVTYPITLETAWGSSELTERPERIAAVGLNGLDAELLISLGVTPVIASSGAASFAEGKFEDSALSFYDVSDYTMSVEEIAASDPDLIVNFGGSVANWYDQLVQIAPVLAPTDAGEILPDWKAALATIAETIDLENAADGVVEEFDAYFEKIREDNPEFADYTLAKVSNFGTDYGLAYGPLPGDTEAEFYSNLGFQPDPLAAEYAEKGEYTISSENLGSITADVVVASSRSSDEDLEAMESLPLWSTIKAVQDGHVLRLDSSYPEILGYTLSYGGPLSEMWVADQLVPGFQEILE